MYKKSIIPILFLILFFSCNKKNNIDINKDHCIESCIQYYLKRINTQSNQKDIFLALKIHCINFYKDKKCCTNMYRIKTHKSKYGGCKYKYNL